MFALGHVLAVSLVDLSLVDVVKGHGFSRAAKGSKNFGL